MRLRAGSGGKVKFNSLVSTVRQIELAVFITILALSVPASARNYVDEPTGDLLDELVSESTSEKIVEPVPEVAVDAEGAKQDAAAAASTEVSDKDPAVVEPVPAEPVPAEPPAVETAGPAGVVGEKPEKKADEGVLAKLLASKKVKFEGSYQLHYTYMPTYAMDEKGQTDGLKHYLDHRFNLRPVLLLSKNLDLLIDVDLIAGQLTGSTTDAGSGIILNARSSNDWTGRAMLRELKLTWKSIAGELAAGQILPVWGLGLVFNGGRPTDRDWNDNWGGDFIERVSFDAVPLAHAYPKSAAAQAFHIMVAGDVVFSDEYADLMDEDHAYGFSGAVYMDFNPKESFYRTFSGVYVNYRWQKYAEGDKLEMTTVDLFTEHEFRLKSGDSFKLSLESAVQAGSSDRMKSDRAPAGFDILGWGLAARAQYNYRKSIEASLEFGAASGDSDPGDSKAFGFTFDPSYQVGMILFQDVLGRSSAWSASRAASGSLGYEPQDGYELSVTNGAVTNAMYVHPQFRFVPAKGLDLRIGFLWARSFSPVASYYNSMVNGGYPLSFRDGPASRDLGMELDVGVYYRTPPIWRTLAVKLGVAGGWCRPGDAFADSSGNGPGNLFKVRVGVDIVF
jgi:hypothetical protein